MSAAVTPKAILSDWTLHPIKGAGVCARGLLPDGTEWMTTEVKKFHLENGRRFVLTESGSVYELGDVKAGVWKIELQLRRLEIFDKLNDAGFI